VFREQRRINIRQCVLGTSWSQDAPWVNTVWRRENSFGIKFCLQRLNVGSQIGQLVEYLSTDLPGTIQFKLQESVLGTYWSYDVSCVKIVWRRGNPHFGIKFCLQRLNFGSQIGELVDNLCTDLPNPIHSLPLCPSPALQPLKSILQTAAGLCNLLQLLCSFPCRF
jgi:hypothetical protein